jgi:sorting nexin-1/2
MGGEYNVIRRYSDFVWLVGELASAFPGVIVPALPEKQTVGRFSPEFVEARRRALEKFLKRCAQHRDLHQAPAFKTFLRADDYSFGVAKEAANSTKPKIAERAFGWLSGTVSSTVNTVTGQGPKIDLPKSPEDIQIEEITRYINAFESQFSNVTKHSSALVKRNRETAQALYDFAQSLTWLGQSEGEALGVALTQVCYRI